MEIKVKDIIGEKLFTRDQILTLRNFILEQKEREIILDFEDCKFITFSSYDEYQKIKEFLTTQNFRLKEKNLVQDL